MKALKIQPDGSIKLPPQVLHRFPSPSELALWMENDTIILKRPKPLKPPQCAEREAEEEMPLEEIAAEVHRMRQEKQNIVAEAESDVALKAARGKGHFRKVFR